MKKTLVPLIERLVQHYSCLVTEEWNAHSHLTRYDYCYQRVNRSNNFVDPTAKLRSQLIERAR